MDHQKGGGRDAGEALRAEPTNISTAGRSPATQGEARQPLPTSLELLPFDRRAEDRRRSMLVEKRRVAVLLPCRNEEATIGEVVRQFHEYLPEAQIWVYDNGSDDRTAEVATAAGAFVRHERRAGKGNVIRRMFAQVDADVYIMADGDATYDASAAPGMIDHLVEHQLDMVVGRRRDADEKQDTYRRGHRLGNAVLTGVVEYTFGRGSADMLSGYRVLSRRYVKSFPASSRGFETETEMTVHALDLNLPFDEIDTRYAERPPGSHSKLRTIPDGLRILAFIVLLLKEHRPATFFGVLGGIAATAAIVTRVALYHPLATHTSVGFAQATMGVLAVAAIMLLLSGLILDSMARSRREIKRLMYLRGDAPGSVGMSPATETRHVVSARRRRA